MVAPVGAPTARSCGYHAPVGLVQPWLEVYLSGLVTLFAMMNPPAAVPLFLTLTTGMAHGDQAAIARRAAVNSAVVLLVCLAAGALVLEFFSISIAALRVAGGMIIAFLGFRLLFEHEDAHEEDRREGEVHVVEPLEPPQLSRAHERQHCRDHDRGERGPREVGEELHQ